MINQQPGIFRCNLRESDPSKQAHRNWGDGEDSRDRPVDPHFVCGRFIVIAPDKQYGSTKISSSYASIQTTGSLPESGLSYNPSTSSMRAMYSSSNFATHHIC